MDADDETDSAARKVGMLELIGLEHRCAELRKALGMTRQVVATGMSKDAERAAHGLIGEYARDFLSIHAGDGTYVWASPSCERLFGWKPSDLIGRSAYDFIHPEDLQRVAQNHAEHVDKDEASTIDYRLRTADDSYRWVSTHSANCKDDRGLPQIVCFTRDISEQRARQEQLEALLARVDEPPDEGQELLRVCAWCKKIAASRSAPWRQLEDYLSELTGRVITHGICESCVEEAELGD